MSIRGEVIDTLEASVFRGPVDAAAMELAHQGLRRYVKHGGLEVIYPDKVVHRYGERVATEDDQMPHVVPELRIRLNSVRPILRIAVDAMLALGEGYMNGELDFEHPTDPSLPAPIDKLAKIAGENDYFQLDRKYGRWINMLRPAMQPNKLPFHKEQVQTQYDIGNEFFAQWLDPTLTYSCADWEDGPENMTLEQAQRAKHRLVTRKVNPQPNDYIIEAGSGWGYQAVSIAKEHNVRVLGLTLSDEQLAASRELAEREGVSDQVDFELDDILELANNPRYWEAFDAGYSVGMFEHVGINGVDDYFKAFNKLTRNGGRHFNHFITQRTNKPAGAFTQTYIFPGGHLHPVGNVINAAADNGFYSPDVEMLGIHYAYTLDAWLRGFDASLDGTRQLWAEGKINHPKIETGQIKGVEEFIRMWRFYLAMSSGGFRYGALDLAQIEFVKERDPSRPWNRRHIYVPETVAEAA